MYCVPRTPDKLVPWRNFIPVAADVSDLDDVVAWIGAHPADCAEIADNSASLAKEIQLGPAMAEAERAALESLRPV
jgi:hypothetical protein